MSGGDIWLSRRWWHVGASGGWVPGMLLNISPCRGESPSESPTQRPVVLRFLVEGINPSRVVCVWTMSTNQVLVKPDGNSSTHLSGFFSWESFSLWRCTWLYHNKQIGVSCCTLPGVPKRNSKELGIYGDTGAACNADSYVSVKQDQSVSVGKWSSQKTFPKTFSSSSRAVSICLHDSAVTAFLVTRHNQVTAARLLFG